MGDLDDVLAFGEIPEEPTPEEIEALKAPEPRQPAEKPEGEPQERQPAQGEPEEKGIDPEQFDRGGLADAPQADEERPLSIEDVLNLSGVLPRKQEKADAEGSPPAPTKEPTETPAPEPTGLEARVKELTERLAQTEEREKRWQDMALKLTDKKEPGEQEGGETDDLDPDMVEYLGKYRKAIGNDPELEKRLAALEDTTAPLVQKTREQELVARVQKHVPGFTAADIPKVVEHHKSLSEDDRADFTGLPGFIVLAMKLNKQEPSKGGSQRVNPVSRRLSAEMGGSDDTRSFDQMTEQEKGDAIMALSDEQVLALLAKSKQG